jgi:hypothetical protein
MPECSSEVKIDKRVSVYGSCHLCARTRDTKATRPGGSSRGISPLGGILLSLYVRTDWRNPEPALHPTGAGALSRWLQFEVRAAATIVPVKSFAKHCAVWKMRMRVHYGWQRLPLRTS